MSNLSQIEQQQLFALVAWIQTFPEFNNLHILFDYEKETVDDVQRKLDHITTILAIAKIAEYVCEVSVDSALSQTPCTETSSMTVVSQRLWNSLLIMTSMHARGGGRPLPNHNNKDASKIKLYVLGNLLDCAVHVADKQKRHTYIGPIMHLHKSTQETIYGIIKLYNNSSTKENSNNTTTYKTSATRTTALQTISNIPSQKETESNSNGLCNQQSHIHYTPSPKQQNLMLRTPDCSFLSPGTMESPQRLYAILQYKQQEIDSMKKIVNNLQQRQEEQKKQMETMKNKHLEEMINVESESAVRIEKIRQKSNEQIKKLKSELENTQQEALQNSRAKDELQDALDEIDVLKDNKNTSFQTLQKLHNCKERIEELGDVNEALRNERAAHCHAIEEIGRLQVELQQLLPVKKQLEGYKTRVAEAEVKLTESQYDMKQMKDQSIKQNNMIYDLQNQLNMKNQELDQAKSSLKILQEMNNDVCVDDRQLIEKGKYDDEFDIKQLKQQYQSSLRAKEKTINELKADIKRKESLVEQSNRQLNEVNDQLIEVHGQFNDVNDQLTEVNGQLNDANDQLNEMRNLLNEKENDIIILSGKTDGKLCKCFKFLEKGLKSYAKSRTIIQE